jgi:2,4-dienoyl-CoA reductase-like NADH-dependent reductase (Old Yellow Enzyme family)/thioredoxin reductase
MFEHLFSPIKINSMVLKNRIIAAPANVEYGQKALGGAGMVITGHVLVEPGRSSFTSKDEPYCFSKYEREKTQELVMQVHQAGAKAAIEVFHGGREARVVDFAKGPMAYVREDGTVVKAMDRAMMEETLQCYRTCVADVKKGGFDCLFLHFGHGWLPAQFLSPYFNQRTDEYGGSFENRARFPLEILKAIRESVGPNFPIDMRISAYEWVENSILFDDVLKFIQIAGDQKLIDSVQISSGLDMNREANVHCITTNLEGYSTNLEYAKEVKKHVNIPVCVVGAIPSPQAAEEAIARGDVDLVAFGRAFIADPNWPKKAMESRPEDIRPCLRCMYCYHIATDHWDVGCSVNPKYHHSFLEQELKEANQPKKIVVIGGGPAGMEFSITAAKRGHKVVLVEKEKELGGQLKYVSLEAHKDEVKRFLDYQKTQIKKSNVKVLLEHEAAPENVKDMNPDAVIIACGAKENLPKIPGLSLGKDIFIATEAIENQKNLGDNIVIIGGGTVGVEIALGLAEDSNKKVTVLEMGSDYAVQANMLYKIAMRQKLLEKKNQIQILTNASCKQVNDHSLLYIDEEGNEKNLEFDSLIVSTGLSAKTDLAVSFYGITPNTIMIGDCTGAKNIKNAVFEGYAAAASI